MLSRRTLLASSLFATLPGIARARQTVLQPVMPPPVPTPDLPITPMPTDALVGPAIGFLGLERAKSYPSLQAALAAAPRDGARHVIAIGDIALKEKAVIDRPNTVIYGLPMAGPIAWDDYSGRTDPADPATTLGTRRTATVTITAPDVTLQDLTIVNSFDYPRQIGLAEGDPKKVHDTQALALAISGKADRVILKNLYLDGWQDTLFVDCGRTYIGNCRISGSVDFIFGAGTVALERCDIVSRYMPGKPSQGYVCAPSTLKETPYGFVFFDCRLTHEGEPFPEGSTALARPWRPTTSFADGRYGNPDVQSACLYLRCVFGDHIAGKGFDHMSYNAKRGTKAFNEPEDARFYISACTCKAVATIPSHFTAPDALVVGLTPQRLLGFDA
jgi:pectinesterase